MKNKIWGICFACLLLVGCSDAEIDSAGEALEKGGEIHPLELTINEEKNVQLFQDARSFSDGVAWIKRSGQWHLINKKGELQFTLKKAEFPSTNFSKGVAIIDKTKMIDTNGKTIFDAKKEGYDEFLVGTDDKGGILGTNSRGYVFARRVEKTVEGEKIQIALINNHGEVVVKPSVDNTHQRYAGDGQFEIGYEDSHLLIYNSDRQQVYGVEDPQAKLTALKFNDNYAVEQYSGDQLPRLFDQYGGQKELTLGLESNNQLKNGQVGMYSNGLFFYQCDFGGRKIQGFYNKEGKQVIDLSLENIVAGSLPYFSEGYCLLRNNKNDTFTIINQDGKKMMQPQGGDTTGADVSNGLLRVQENDDLYRFIDMDGKTVLRIDGKDYATIGDDEVIQLDVASYKDGWIRVKAESRAFYLSEESDFLSVDFSRLNKGTETAH